MEKKCWEELHLLISKEMLAEFEHVKVHRTKKDKKEMSHFLRSLSLKATRMRMSWQKTRAMSAEGFMAEA